MGQVIAYNSITDLSEGLKNYENTSRFNRRLHSYNDFLTENRISNKTKTGSILSKGTFLTSKGKRNKSHQKRNEPNIFLHNIQENKKKSSEKDIQKNQLFSFHKLSQLIGKINQRQIKDAFELVSKDQNIIMDKLQLQREENLQLKEQLRLIKEERAYSKKNRNTPFNNNGSFDNSEVESLDKTLPSFNKFPSLSKIKRSAYNLGTQMDSPNDTTYFYIKERLEYPETTKKRKLTVSVSVNKEGKHKRLSSTDEVVNSYRRLTQSIQSSLLKNIPSSSIEKLGLNHSKAIGFANKFSKKFCEFFRIEPNRKSEVFFQKRTQKQGKRRFKKNTISIDKSLKKESQRTRAKDKREKEVLKSNSRLKQRLKINWPTSTLKCMKISSPLKMTIGSRVPIKVKGGDNLWNLRKYKLAKKSTLDNRVSKNNSKRKNREERKSLSNIPFRPRINNDDIITARRRKKIIKRVK